VLNGEHLIFVKTLLLASSFFLFPRSKRASQQESLKTPISSLPAFIEMLLLNVDSILRPTMKRGFEIKKIILSQRC
jgi:hypothetical protein